jgi:hypothetical protein
MWYIKRAFPPLDIPVRFMKKLLIAVTAVTLLAGCGDEDNAKSNANSTVAKRVVVASQPYNPGAPTVKTVSIQKVDAGWVALNDGTTHTIILADVAEGTPAEWAATAVAIAEKAVALGAASAKVTLLRADVTQREGYNLRRATEVYYDTKNAPPWIIVEADAKTLVTQQEVNAQEEYDSLYKKYTQAGMDEQVADDKAGRAVQRKYHLPKNWSLMLTARASGNDISRSTFNVDTSAVEPNLDNLARCIENRTACEK